MAVNIDYCCFKFYNFFRIKGGIMKFNLCAKTILMVDRYLERITEAIDRLIERRALNSFYVGLCGGSENSITSVADYIINLSERKVKLINLKILIDMALEACPILSAQILIERYMDNEKSFDIAKRHNLSERTYFRRLNEALEHFSLQMSNLGFSEKRLLDYISSEKWIMEVYNRLISAKSDDCVQIDERQLGKLVAG